MTETIQEISQGLAGARASIAKTRQSLQAAPEGIPEFEQAIVRLERIEAEMARIEKVVVEQTMGAR